MTSRLALMLTRHQRTIEWAFALLFLALFLYSVADWFRWLPFDGSSNPLRMLLLSAALLTLPLAALVRARKVAYVLMGLSVVLLLRALVTPD